MCCVCFSDSDVCQNNRHLDKASVGGESSSSEMTSSESDSDSDSPSKQKPKSTPQPVKKVRRGICGFDELVYYISTSSCLKHCIDLLLTSVFSKNKLLTCKMMHFFNYII